MEFSSGRRRAVALVVSVGAGLVGCNRGSQDGMGAPQGDSAGTQARAHATALQAAAAVEAPRGLVAAAAVSAGSWFPLGPTPLGDGPTYGDTTVPASGRATVIAFNPALPSEVWLGTATGGAWHTVNAQLTDPEWVPIDGLQFPDFVTEGPPGAMAMSIGAIAVDGCVSTGGCARVWIGTGEGGVRRDTFYGAGLFLQTPDEIPGIDPLFEVAEFRGGSIVSIALPPHTAATTDTVYIAVSSGVTAPGTEATVTAPTPAGGYGIYAATDASSFNKLPIPGLSGSLPTSVQMDPNDSTGKTLLVGVMAADLTDPNAARGILRGTNGGFNATDWCSVNDNSVAGIPSCAGSSGLPSGNSVVASPPANGRDEVLGFVSIRFSPSVANRVYARFGQCGQRTDTGCPATTVFVSQNGGLAWTPVAVSSSTVASQAFYDRYTHAFAVVPGGTAGAEQLIIGGTELMSCSGQGSGCSALGSSLSQTHPDQHDFAIPGASAPGVMYAANDGGFYFSTDSGSNWISGNTTLTTSQFDSLAVYDQQLLGGLQDQGCGFFTGTRVWANRAVGDGGFAVVYAVGNPVQTVWYYSGQQTTPYRSINDPTANLVSLGANMPASAATQAANNGALLSPDRPEQRHPRRVLRHHPGLQVDRHRRRARRYLDHNQPCIADAARSRVPRHRKRQRHHRSRDRRRRRGLRRHLYR